MNNFIALLLIALFFTVTSNAQIPQDYPFRTCVDAQGYLYITGQSNGNIVTKKYPPAQPFYNNPIWVREYLNPGLDFATGISLSSDTSLYVTGYIFNAATNSNDVITIRYSSISGEQKWVRIYGGAYDDRAYGVASDPTAVYVTGFKTTKLNNRNLLVLKYNSGGDLTLPFEYNDPVYKGEDVGTAVFDDMGFIYVTGYTYQGTSNGNDIIHMTFAKSLVYPPQINIYSKRGTNETPTSCILSYMSDNSVSKSRSGIGSISDNITIQNQTDYLTLSFKGESYSTLAWAQTFSGPGNGRDIPTSIAADDSGNVYVTGYSYRNSLYSNDYATIKYNKDGGLHGWNGLVYFFNYGSGNSDDRASSIKTRDKKVYVTGTSQNSPGSYHTISYQQTNGGIIKEFERVFTPTFNNQDAYYNLNRAAALEIDSSGNLIVIVYAWDTMISEYAAVKYDSLGNILYILDQSNPGDDGDARNAIQNTPNEFKLRQNFPNPFNPSTVIRYSLTENSLITLRVYDVLGNEVTTLVNERKNAGSHSVDFDGSDFSSGIYFYKLIIGGLIVDTKRMILLK